MSRAPQAVRADWAARGYEAVQTPDEARLIISDLMQHPAYMDPRHREHGEILAETRHLYDAITLPGADE